MKTIRNILLLSLICLLSTPAVYAKNGAEIYKYPEFLWVHFEWNSQDLMAVFSSDSDAYCGGDSEEIPYEVTWLGRPNGFWKYHDRGFYFTRVFLVTPDDLDTLDPDYCVLWNDSARMLAEGITHGVANGSPQGFGYTISGVLYDLDDLCEGGMVELNIIRKTKILKNCDADCEVPHVFKGPRLNCPE